MSNDISSLFGKTNGISGMVGDYNAIKNGSYGKLVKSYYGQNKATETGKAASNHSNKNNVVDKLIQERKTPKLSKEVTQANAKLNDSVRGLTGSLSALQSKDTFKNKETATKSLKDFVASYNDAVESSKKTNMSNISKNIAGLMEATRENEDALKEMGVTIRNDGTLALDEARLAAADFSKMEELFDGEEAMSYGSKAASRLNRAAVYVNEANAEVAAEEGSKEVTGTNSRSLMDTLKSVKSDELFATTRNELGEDEYNVDAITDEAENLIKYYNATLASARNTTDTGITGNLSSMIQKTAQDSGDLAEIGINVGTDGRLSMNKSQFEASDMSKVQDTFAKYATDIEGDARLLNYYSANAAETATGYSANGGYNLTSGDIVSQMYDNLL